MSIIWKDAEVWTALPGPSQEDQGGGEGAWAPRREEVCLSPSGVRVTWHPQQGSHALTPRVRGPRCRGFSPGTGGQGQTGGGAQSRGPQDGEGMGSTSGWSRATLRSPYSGSGAEQDAAASAAAGPWGLRGPWAQGSQAALQSGAGTDPA